MATAVVEIAMEAAMVEEVKEDGEEETTIMVEIGVSGQTIAMEMVDGVTIAALGTAKVTGAAIADMARIGQTIASGTVTSRVTIAAVQCGAEAMVVEVAQHLTTKVSELK